ncbi:MAG: LytR family transcriptional regulator [Ruminococcaceae bacterium]|nr:LytR family transcriptional regulator [Oscillospiraceae bacterium]
MIKKKYYTVLTTTILMFVAMLAVVGIMASYLWNYTPEGPNVPTDTMIHYDENNNPVVVKPLEDKTFNFLVLGHDRMATLTDVIMLINYNVTEGSISIMQFPRDTYVGYGVATSKINVSYATFFNEARGKGSDTPELDALRKFADHLESALCTKISYCAIMDLNGFINIVDAIGGVEMNVPTKMYYNDPDQNLYIDLQPGYQTLNGAQAEQFVRYRYGYLQGDLGRQDAQKIFMSAFIEKVQKSVNVSTLTTLAETVLDNLYTDMTVSDFVYFGKNVLSVDMSKVSMISMPCNPAGNHVVMAKKAMIDIVNKHFNVYDTDITEGIFDRDKIFVNNYDQTFINAYYSEKSTYGGTEYDAGNVNDSSIDIPHH